jgi:hypothetical protein
VIVQSKKVFPINRKTFFISKQFLVFWITA